MTDIDNEAVIEGISNQGLWAVDDSAFGRRGTGESPTPLIASTTNNPSIPQPRAGAEGYSPSPLPLGKHPVKSNLDETHYVSFMFNNTANLEAHLVQFQAKTECLPRYIVLMCECGRSVVPSTCMSLTCTRCADAIGRRRASRAYDRIMSTHHTGDAVIYTVFTVPIERRFKFKDPKVWQRVRKKAWSILKKHFGAAYGVEASHPIGDKDQEKFHPHLNFIWKQHSGFRPFIDITKLRYEWAKVLQIDKVDVKTNYTRDNPRIRHWCNYVMRVFPGYHKWSGPIRWYGAFPKMERSEQSICCECGCVHKVIGEISAFLVDEWYANPCTKGRAPPWYFEKNVRVYGRYSSL